MENLVTAIATTGILLVSCITAFYAARQFRAHRRITEYKAFQDLLRYVEEPSLRRARWFVYHHPEIFHNLPDLPHTDGWQLINQRVIELSGDQKIDLHSVDLVLNSLNDIAYLVNNRYVPEKIVVDFLGHTFHRCWVLYEPYVEYRRNHRVTPLIDTSKYACELEQLVKRLCKRQTILPTPQSSKLNSPAHYKAQKAVPTVGS